MELYVIRHTPVDLESGICYGQSNVGLSESFSKDLLQFEFLKNVDFDKVISSPLDRCTELTRALGFDTFLTDNRVLEMNFGDWELKAWNAINPVELQYWMDNFDTVQTPNGESFEDLVARVKAFYNELKQSKLEKVLLITHAGVIRAFWTILLEIELKNAFKIPVGHGEILKINSTFDTIIQKQ